MNRHFCSLLTLLMVILASGPANGQQDDAARAVFKIEQPSRSFGYFIGDVLVQRIGLDEAIALDAEFEDGQRIDEYLYRLPVMGTQTSEHIDGHEHAFELRYQIVNIPDATGRISLPAVRLQTASGKEVLLQPWAFTVSPLSAGTPLEDREMLQLVPDRSPLAVMARPDTSVLKRGFVALLGVIVLWLAWWTFRHFADAYTLPFAKARKAIAKIRKGDREAEPEMWIALHHAFNDVAGKTIAAGAVPELLSAAPWLTPERDAIERFYMASDERFFRQVDSPPAVDVAALCDTLYRLEKREAKPTSRQAVA